jgi:hypothetical protein
MTTSQRRSLALGCGTCLALLLFLATSLMPIWLKPPSPRPRAELEIGTFWESLAGIRLRAKVVPLEDVFWELRDNWVVAGIVAAVGFAAGYMTCQARQQPRRPPWPHGPGGLTRFGR